MPENFTDFTELGEWVSTDYMVGYRGTDEVRWTPETILGTSGNRVPTKVHLGSNGLDSDGPIVVNPVGATGFSAGGDDLIVSGSGNRGASFYSSDTGSFITIWFGDVTNGKTAGQIQWGESTNALLLRAGESRILLDGDLDGPRFWDAAVSGYGDEFVRYKKPFIWTPELRFGGSTTGITYDATKRKGILCQLGHMTYIFSRFVLTSKGSATGAATITGSPVGDTTAAQIFHPLMWGPHGEIVLADSSQAYYNGSTISLWKAASGSARVAMDETDFEDTTELTVSGWFYTDV